MSRIVYCTFSVVGFHKYPDAPMQVDYLQNEHRHVFHFKVSVEVSHDNREIEFHCLRRDCINFLETSDWYDSKLREYLFGARSCEMIADELIQRMLQDRKYSIMQDLGTQIPRQIIVRVSEDGENGGVAYRFPLALVHK